MEWLFNLLKTMFGGKSTRAEEVKVIVTAYRKLVEDLQKMITLLEERNARLETKDDQETHELLLQIVNLIKEKKELESQLLFWSKLKNGNGKH